MQNVRAALLVLLCATVAIRTQAQLPTLNPAAPQPAKPSAPQAAQTPPVTPDGPHPLTAADLEAFFDGILPMQLNRGDIAGATVLVMQNGQVLLQKGYGYSDFKKKQPVDPATTVFRLASISKLSTWISIMQLQEQGKLDLDTDVNQYLDFKINPAPHGISDKPITLRNLMTHTGGFEEEIKDIIITNPKYAISLRDFLIQNQPHRIFPPGEIPAYSNYGVGLASYIVQRVSGEPFEKYTEEHIYTPLKMQHSTFFQPLPKPLTASEGYNESTTKPPIGFEIFNPVGAGGFSSTAADMGRLGQALLNGGELDGAHILKPETLAAMWTPQFRASPALPPIDMGFYETWRNNLHWIGHGGDLIAFHSLFVVEPTQKLVLFLSYNSAASASHTRPEIISLFSDRYFPAPHSQNFLKLSQSDLKDLTGQYQATRRAETTRYKTFALSQSALSVDKDGVLTFGSAKDLREHPIKWKPIAKDLFQEVDGQHLLFAVRDSKGKVVRLATEFAGSQSQRVPWYENSAHILPLLGASLIILLAAVVATLHRFTRRLFFRKRPKPTPVAGTRWLPHATQLAAWLWSTTFIAIISFFAAQGEDLLPPTPAWDKYFMALNIILVLLIALSVAAIISALRISRSATRPITKLKFGLVALACAFLSWFAIHWNLISQTHRI